MPKSNPYTQVDLKYQVLLSLRSYCNETYYHTTSEGDIRASYPWFIPTLEAIDQYFAQAGWKENQVQVTFTESSTSFEIEVVWPAGRTAYRFEETSPGSDLFTLV